MTDQEKRKTFERILHEVAHEMAEDRYMLMEYLGPVVDGCRAALNVSIEKARNLRDLTDEDFQNYMKMAGDSFKDITICFHALDTDERFSIVFSDGDVQIVAECIDADVVISGNLETLREAMDFDSKVSPVDLLGEHIHVTARDARDALVGLGLLTFPTLLRMARSGIDPSSLLSEDADAVIIATASDIVTKMVRKWLDLHIKVAK